LGTGDVAAYGGKIAKTPNIDALAASGARLTDAHVTAPVCSPSRVAILSGKYQERFGYEFNPIAAKVIPLPLDQQTLADRLKAQGYVTQQIGKWHLGWKPELRPDKRGFDGYFGMASGSGYFPTGFPGVERVARFAASEDGGNGLAEILRNGEPVDIKKNLTDAFSDEAVAFIDKNRTKPFFLYLAYNAPHTPLEIDQERFKRFPASTPFEQRVLAGMVASVDDGIGRIRAELERRGLSKSTVIFLISDNGCPLYLGGACFNADLQGGKRHLLEGGVRTPFIVSWPGLVKPGVFDGLASTLDITPTALTAAGAPLPPGLDGVDLMPFLSRARTGDPHDMLFWRSTPSLAVRSGQWKLIRAQHPDGPEMETFLFDVRARRGEAPNVAADHPDIVKRLLEAGEAWSKELPPASFAGRRETIEIDGRRVVQTF
jgi:arylsulfatase A-like enzyme